MLLDHGDMQNFINFIYRERERKKIKMAIVQMLFQFFMMMKLDDWKEECEI